MLVVNSIRGSVQIMSGRLRRGGCLQRQDTCTERAMHSTPHFIHPELPTRSPSGRTWQYAALATQIGTIQQAEAPRRVVKAVSPAIKKVKRKAALPPEARGQAK